MHTFYPFSIQQIVSRLTIKMLVIIIILLAGASAPQAVHAAGGTAHFSISPSFTPHSNATPRGYFAYTSQPGFLIQDSLHVANVGTARGAVDLYAVDATTDQASGVTFLTPTDPRSDVGAWITLSSQELTLNPGQSQDVMFRLNVPNQVRPGQHSGGIIARDATDQTSTSSSGAVHTTVHVQTQEILGVLVNLPGTLVQKLDVTGITYDKKSTSQSLLIGLANDGTQMVRPSGSLQITDKKGHLLQNVPLKLDVILPQTAINYPVGIVNNALKTGTYTASVSLNYEGGHSAKYEAHFSVPRPQPATKQAIPKPMVSQALPKPVASQLLPKPGTGHTMIAHNVPSNPAPFNGLMSWQYISVLLVIMVIVGGLFLWIRRLYVSHRRRFAVRRRVQRR